MRRLLLSRVGGLLPISFIDTLMLCLQLAYASGDGGTAHCTRQEATDFQAPGSKCPAKPCADLGGDGSKGHAFASADAQACCQLCADYTGAEVCKYAVFQSAAPKDRNCFLKAGPADAIGGVGNLGMELLPPSSGWGSTMVVMIVLFGTGYVGGGIVIGMRTSGKTGLKAHPHFHKWVDLKGLVVDGGSSVRSGPARSGSAKQRLSRDPEGGYHSTAETEPLQITTRDRKKNSKKQKDAVTNNNKRDSKKHTNEGRAALAAASASTLAQPPQAPSAGRESAAGGGGRWIHVPA